MDTVYIDLGWLQSVKVINKSTYNFLFTLYKNYVSTLYCFQDIISYLLKVADFSYPMSIWYPC